MRAFRFAVLHPAICRGAAATLAAATLGAASPAAAIVFDVDAPTSTFDILCVSNAGGEASVIREDMLPVSGAGTFDCDTASSNPDTGLTATMVGKAETGLGFRPRAIVQTEVSVTGTEGLAARIVDDMSASLEWEVAVDEVTDEVIDMLAGRTIPFRISYRLYSEWENTGASASVGGGVVSPGGGGTNNLFRGRETSASRVQRLGEDTSSGTAEAGDSFVKEFTGQQLSRGALFDFRVFSICGEGPSARDLTAGESASCFAYADPSLEFDMEAFTRQSMDMGLAPFELADHISLRASTGVVAGTAPPAVPLPAAGWLLLGGLAATAGLARRRRRA